MYAKVAKVYGKNESSIHEIMKMDQEITASFAIVLQTSKVRAKRHKCLVQMETALNLWVEE